MAYEKRATNFSYNNFKRKIARMRKECERMANKEVSILRVDNRSFLNIGEENIEIADYGIKSSADGSTELLVIIKGTAPVLEFKASVTITSPLERLRESVEEHLRHLAD